MVSRDLKFGFIGIGVLGKGLALALASRGYQVVAAHSRNHSSAQWLADRIPQCQVCGSKQELADASDLVFITTPDAVISEVAEAIAWKSGQAVVHCCGAAGTDILGPAAKQGAVTGAFHPYQTFAGLEDSSAAATRLNGVTFGVTAQGWLGEFLPDLARNLGGSSVSILDQNRAIYHASAVLSCGYLVTLIQAAVDLWESMGFTSQQALQAIYPLARTTLENVAKNGTLASVTGPVVRGDCSTIGAHLESISRQLPELAPLYQSLTSSSLPLAAQAGVSLVQLAEIRELIDNNNWRSGTCRE